MRLVDFGMARYKDYNLDQRKLIPIVFSEQITPGTFERTLSFLIDEHTRYECV